MTNEIAIALTSLAGSAVGALGGIIVSNKLTNHRLEQLEKKVEKHNNVMERTFRLEEQMKTANHRLGDLEREK